MNGDLTSFKEDDSDFECKKSVKNKRSDMIMCDLVVTFENDWSETLASS